MRSLGWFLVTLLLCGCFHWGRIDSLSEVEGATRVRIEPPDQPALVLEHPSVELVRNFVVTARARVYVKKLNAWGTALIITGAAIASLATALFILGIVAAGAAGG